MTTLVYCKLLYSWTSKCEVTGSGQLQKSDCLGLYEGKSRHIYFFNRMYCMQYLAYNIYNLLLKPWVCGAYSEHKDLQTTVWGSSLVEVKNKTVIPKSGHSLVTVSNISFSFKRGSNYKALIGKILVHWKSCCLWEVAAFERCLFIRGGHIWRFDWSLHGMTLGLESCVNTPNTLTKLFSATKTSFTTIKAIQGTR